MSLRNVLRQSRLVQNRYKDWYARLIKTNTQESNLEVSALGNLIDYFGRETNAEVLNATDNYEIKWEEWGHILTPGVVDGLRSKFEELK